MSATNPIYLELVDFIASGPTSQEVADFHPSREARERVLALIERERESTPTPEEKTELNEFLELEHILRMAKARARLILASEVGCRASAARSTTCARTVSSLIPAARGSTKLDSLAYACIVCNPYKGRNLGRLTFDLLTRLLNP